MRFSPVVHRIRMRGLVLVLGSLAYRGLIYYLSSIAGEPNGEAGAIERIFQWLTPNVQRVLHIPLYGVLA